LYRERDESTRQEFLKELEKIDLEDRVYLDESGVNQYIFRNFGRAACEEKVIGEISGKRFVRESFISALFQGKLLSPMCFQETCNTELFNTWMEKMLIPKLKPGQVLILDNASFHRSEKSKTLVEEAGCRLLFLPPYSPDLNPIEKYWANLKVKIRELLRSGQEFISSIDQAIVAM